MSRRGNVREKVGGGRIIVGVSSWGGERGRELREGVLMKVLRYISFGVLSKYQGWDWVRLYCSPSK